MEPKKYIIQHNMPSSKFYILNKYTNTPQISQI